MSQQMNNFKNGFRAIGRGISYEWKKHGSEICTIGGTALLVGSGVKACRKTYKLHHFLEESGKKIQEAKKPVGDEKRITRWFRVTKVRTVVAGKVVWKFIPEIAGAAFGGYGIGKGWATEHKHYKEAVAFGSLVFSDFMNYRKHVIAEHGEETDRRYLHTKLVDGKLTVEADTEDGQTVSASEETEGISVAENPNAFRIWYSRETTPSLWSPNYNMRLINLQWATNEIDKMLIDGQYCANEVRRLFYGRKGDVGIGNIYGRIFEPGNPEHPERGRMTNLHYQDDEDFMRGRTDSCWLTIEVDPEPIIDRIGRKFTEVEV